MPFQKRKEMRSVSPSSDLSVLERGGERHSAAGGLGSRGRVRPDESGVG
jgi:hypothetical protein